MSAIVPAFFAYPSSPTQVGEVVEHAVRNLKEQSGIEVVQSWRQLDIAGRFIADQVLNRIRSSRRMLRNIISMKRMKLDTHSFPTK